MKKDKDYYYFLGLLAADGYRTRYGLGIDLNDHEIVLACAKFFSCNAPKTYGDKMRVLISNTVVLNDMITLGLRNPLKKDMHFPKLPAKYLSHFICGYFDGDGSMTYESNGSGYMRTRANIRGPHLFIDGLRNTIGYGSVNHSNPRCATYYVSSKADVIKFASFIYKDRSLFIKRKYARVPRP